MRWNVIHNALGQPIGFLPAVDAPARPPHADGGRYCRLEPMHERFVPELYAGGVARRRRPHLDLSAVRTVSSEDEFRRWLLRECLGEDPLFFVIVDAATGRAVGQASYLNIKPGQGSIEVGHVYFSR
jgi:RimJ/RimL family protein N-acetyltransferase